MKFINFLKAISNKSLQLKPGALCFTGNIYPPFLFEALFKKIAPVAPTLINLSLHSAPEIKAMLSQTILGEIKLLWFANISETTKTQQKYFFDSIANYSGPHIVVFFSSPPPSSEKAIFL